MISGILSSILGYILIIGFIFSFFGGCIYIIICGIREYLEESDRFCLFVIIMGCIGIMMVVIIILKTFGL
jgi:hypothetical protein